MRDKRWQLTLNHHGRSIIISSSSLVETTIIESPTPTYLISPYNPSILRLPRRHRDAEKKRHCKISFLFLVLLQVHRQLPKAIILKSNFFVPCSPSRNKEFSRFHSSLFREIMNMVTVIKVATFLDHSSLIWYELINYCY